MKLLVSVRDVDEALRAADCGADFIDLKEPRAGALGALPLPAVREVVAALREHHANCMISATVGDLFEGVAPARVIERVTATAAAGVDYVKVGIAPGAHALLDALIAMAAAPGVPRASNRAIAAGCNGGAGESAAPAIVPVFIADRGVDAALVERACASLAFPALMLDTADKGAGSLFDTVSDDVVRGFVARVRSAGKLCGLAGALRVADVPRLVRLGSDFAGFRSAVCEGGRAGTLDAARVRALRVALAPYAFAPLAREGAATAAGA